ncbi:MAG: hypothetical protein ACK5XQ_00260 [Flavobacteriales bacterium]
MSMGAMIMQADDKSSKLLKELAKRMGARVTIVNEAQYEEFLLGQLMESVKTGKKVSKEAIFRKLREK